MQLVIEDMLKSINPEATEEYNNVKIITYRNVLHLGAKSFHSGFPPKKDDIAIIMFTSGSTGH
jgi:long-subunit acyl-CoA synthetase (AMP-forming)